MRAVTVGLVLLSLGLVGCASPRAAGPAPLAPNAAPTAAVDPDDPAAVAGPTTAEAPRAAGPWIAVAGESDYSLIGSTEQSFGVFVDVPKGTAAGHVPTAITLAIDTSGSMRGDKIAHAREAAQRIVSELEPGDRVAVVTFSGRADVLVPTTELDEHSRARILDVLEELSADGGTAMHDGLKVAESEMWSTPDTHLVRRLVVISDGKATVGPTAPAELGNVAQVGLQQGIQVTSIGVGLDYDEVTLNELAIRSSGRLYHVEHSRQLPSVVEQEIALLESTAAADAKVELVAAPGVTLLGTDTAHAERTSQGLIIPLGTMFDGQAREVLVRARIDGVTDEGAKVLASVRLHFRDPADGGVPRVQETVLRTNVTDDPSLVAAHQNPKMQTLLAMREASSLTQLASSHVGRGDFDGADLELARAEKRLREQAKNTRDRSERQRVMKSASQIASTRKKMDKAKRAPAPARAKAGRAAALELNDAAMEADGF